MKARDSFIFYRSFAEAINDMDDVDIAAFVRALSAFALDNNEPDFDNMPKIARMTLRMALPTVKANNDKYAAYIDACNNGEKGGKYGALGGRPKKKTTPEVNPQKPHIKTPKNPQGVILENPKGITPKNPIHVHEDVHVNVPVDIIDDNKEEIINKKNNNAYTREVVFNLIDYGKLVLICSHTFLETNSLDLVIDTIIDILADNPDLKPFITDNNVLTVLQGFYSLQDNKWVRKHISSPKNYILKALKNNREEV